jgi:hypothetical protein
MLPYLQPAVSHYGIAIVSLARSCGLLAIICRPEVLIAAALIVYIQCNNDFCCAAQQVVQGDTIARMQPFDVQFLMFAPEQHLPGDAVHQPLMAQCASSTLMSLMMASNYPINSSAPVRQWHCATWHMHSVGSHPKRLLSSWVHARRGRVFLHDFLLVPAGAATFHMLYMSATEGHCSTSGSPTQRLRVD